MIGWFRKRMSNSSLDNCNSKGNDDEYSLSDEFGDMLDNRDPKVSGMPLILGCNNNSKKKAKKGKKNNQKPIIVLPACCGAPCGYPLGNCGTGMNHPFLQSPGRGNFNPLHCLAQCCCNNSNAQNLPRPPFDIQSNYPQDTNPNFPQDCSTNFPQDFCSNYLPECSSNHPSTCSYDPMGANFCSNNPGENAMMPGEACARRREKERLLSVTSSVEAMFSKLLSIKNKLRGFEMDAQLTNNSNY